MGVFVDALADTDAGIRGDVLNRLSRFKKELFTLSDHERVKANLRVNTVHLDRLIKIAGYLGVDCRSELGQIANSIKSGGIQWACQLALARMNDEASINSIIQKLEQRVVDDRYVYTILPQLVYTHQRALLKYVIEVVNSDELNCLSSNADAEQKIKCSYRALEYLAPAIQNFPFKVDDMGMLEVTDYEASLAAARAWLLGNENYTIDDSRF